MGCFLPAKIENTHLDSEPYFQNLTPLQKQTQTPYLSDAQQQQEQQKQKQQQEQEQQKQQKKKQQQPDKKENDKKLVLREKIGFCPLHHPLKQIKGLSKAIKFLCNNCKSTYLNDGQYPFIQCFVCTLCKFQACCRCFRKNLKHTDICDNPQLVFGSYLRLKQNQFFQCTLCGKFLANYVYCKSCLTLACAKCLKIRKNSKCIHDFQFNNQTPLWCVYCQVKELHMECKKCKIHICIKCYKEEFLKEPQNQ